MLVSDLLHSCANECVAEAAISSIGGEFASLMQSEAEHRGISVGHFASSRVREFARGATERDWRDLIDAVRGQDFPVLTGLQVILSKSNRRPSLNTIEALRRPVKAGTRSAVDHIGCGSF